MKTKLAFLLILVSGYSFSQDLPDLKAYSKDIGFNTNFILNGIINSSGSPFDIMLKKQKTSNTAIRYGTSFYVNLSTNTNTGSNSFYQTNSYSLSVSIGKEKQNQLSKKWIFYYGGDLAPFYNSYELNYYNSGQIQSNNNNNDFGLRLSPFLGIRFQITDRLYVGTEALLRLSFSRNEAGWKSYNNATVTAESSNSFNNLRFHALPANGIFIFYRF